MAAVRCMFLLCWAMSLLAAPDESPSRIAVNTFTAHGVSASEAVSLTDAFRSELSKTEKFHVLERTQMDQVLREQGFQQSGACSEASCAIEMGRNPQKNIEGCLSLRGLDE